MVICLDLHLAQLMPLPLPLTVSYFSKIQIGFTFLVPAHLGSPGKRAVKQVCECVRVCVCVRYHRRQPSSSSSRRTAASSSETQSPLHLVRRPNALQLPLTLGREVADFFMVSLSEHTH